MKHKTVVLSGQKGGYEGTGNCNDTGILIVNLDIF